jgi:hypothetical protein
MYRKLHLKDGKEIAQMSDKPAPFWIRPLTSRERGGNFAESDYFHLRPVPSHFQDFIFEIAGRSSKHQTLPLNASWQIQSDNAMGR